MSNQTQSDKIKDAFKKITGMSSTVYKIQVFLNLIVGLTGFIVFLIGCAEIHKSLPMLIIGVLLICISRYTYLDLENVFKKFEIGVITENLNRKDSNSQNTTSNIKDFNHLR